MTAKQLERLHILRTLINYGPRMSALDIVRRANAECDHDALEDLGELTNRGIGQKLNAMSLDGLVHGERQTPPRKRAANPPMLWTVTAKGHQLAQSIGPLDDADAADNDPEGWDEDRLRDELGQAQRDLRSATYYADKHDTRRRAYAEAIRPLLADAKVEGDQVVLTADVWARFTADVDAINHNRVPLARS